MVKIHCGYSVENELQGDKSGYGSPVKGIMLSKDEINVIWTTIVVMQMNKSRTT